MPASCPRLSFRGDSPEAPPRPRVPEHTPRVRAQAAALPRPCCAPGDSGSCSGRMRPVAVPGAAGRTVWGRDSRSQKQHPGTCRPLSEVRLQPEPVLPSCSGAAVQSNALFELDLREMNLSRDKCSKGWISVCPAPQTQLPQQMGMEVFSRTWEKY